METTDLCCGCTACMFVCGQSAIRVRENERGFQTAIIDELRCIHCNRCKEVCPINEQTGNKHRLHSQVYLAVKRKDQRLRMKSQSGGVFYALAEQILHDGGVVYGVQMNNQCEAVYARIEKERRLAPLRGSKYVQARLGDTFQSVCDDLQNQKYVLFSGTPCHVKGLKLLLKEKNANMDNLYTVDLVCHGVPSPLVFREHISELEKRYGQKVNQFVFRDKQFGWHGHVGVAMTKNRQYVTNEYVKVFYSSFALNECCYHCRFANLNRPGDITIGDCWGIEKAYPEFDDNKGCSLIILNNPKGSELWGRISAAFDIQTMEKNQILQPNLLHPTEKPNGVEAFWSDFRKYGVEYIAYRYGKSNPSKEYELIQKYQVFRRVRRKFTKIYHRAIGQ